jgi:hypothetical protein
MSEEDRRSGAWLPPVTVDVDLIVPDVEFALEKLSINGFKQNPGSRMTVTDRETKVRIGKASDIDLGTADLRKAVNLFGPGYRT